MKSGLPDVSRWLVNVFFAAAVLLAVVVWLPEAFCMKAYVVKSSSMEPTIKAGSVIYVRAYQEDEQVSPGDIISFTTGEVMVTHRVVSVNQEEKTAVTKGDANQVCDPKSLPLDAIQGKVEFHLPLLGYLLLK
ncbi:MAG: signal peptidase I [Lachnospiraceae bacterium]|nr:signal peptidase I [Lachnospiraceae bacterium]